MVEILEADFDPDDSINALVENGMTRLMGVMELDMKVSISQRMKRDLS